MVAFAGLIVVAVCVSLGLWQMQRLHTRRALNDELLSRHKLPILALATTSLRDGDGRGDPAAYRRVTVTGRYDVEHEVILRSRSLNGNGGNHVLTPLRGDRGDRGEQGLAILVDRGWVPLDHDMPPVRDATPPSTAVTITGVLVPSEPKPIAFGPSDPKTGTLHTIGRIDMSRLRAQIPYPIAPMYLALEEQDPSQGGTLPVIAGLPAPGEGPHFAYAVQWFLFAAVGLVTTVVLIRSERRAPSRKDADHAG